jgi:phosphoribosylformylglycinamidine (FGAM) synthase PurS component
LNEGSNTTDVADPKASRGLPTEMCDIQREFLSGVNEVRENKRLELQAEKEDQEMAETCKRLIKNCISCWNYLYLSQKFAEIDDPVQREEFLKAVAHGLAAAT